ncbi:MAG: glycoside hydrolase family 88 protein [Alphaproteobacteria bacterium]|nr:glycoside hydrolase family 88 protein [Alphaproteobacteria bacterium]
MLAEFFDQYAASYDFAKRDGGWCYEDGCIYRGLLELSRATGDAHWFDHLCRLIATQLREDGTIKGYAPEEYNIDHILSGRVLFALRQSAGDRFDRALDLLASQLERHPRTASGNYWHKKIYPDQVWLDGLYMGLPFQIEYGLLRGRGDLVDDAAGQILRAVSLMRDKVTGLHFHGYDQSRRADWCDPQTGLSASFWGRANGWLSMAMIDAYELLPGDHAARADLKARIIALAEAVLARRTANGLWLQVMDRPDLEGNYEETSASAMFAYFLLKSARLIAALAPLAADGDAAVAALRRHHVSRPEGIWRIDNACEVAGLGGFFGKKRDGSAHYYTTEPVVSNDPKAVGPLMMAVAEQERAEIVHPLARTGG